MVDVHLERATTLPGRLTFEALCAIIDEIQRGDDAWQGFALHAELSAAHLPDVGEVSVPVAIHSFPADPHALRREITIEAARHTEAFPRFRGRLSVSQENPHGCVLRLDGGYDVPLHAFGALANAMLVRGLAVRTLENFLHDLEAACRTRIESSESEILRHSLFQHG